MPLVFTGGIDILKVADKMINVQIQIFLTLAVGYLVTKLGVLTREGRSQLTNLVLYVILPCDIFRSFGVEMTGEILAEIGVETAEWMAEAAEEEAEEIIEEEPAEEAFEEAAAEEIEETVAEEPIEEESEEAEEFHGIDIEIAETDEKAAEAAEKE